MTPLPTPYFPPCLPFILPLSSSQVLPGGPCKMVDSDHGCQAFCEPVVVTLQLSVVLPHVRANQGLVLPQGIIAPVKVCYGCNLFTAIHEVTKMINSTIQCTNLVSWSWGHKKQSQRNTFTIIGSLGDNTMSWPFTFPPKWGSYLLKALKGTWDHQTSLNPRDVL